VLPVSNGDDITQNIE
jgi:hypothetical protein